MSSTMTLPTADELAETIKAEVLSLVASGELPATVRTFDDLNAHLDANCLGDTEAAWGSFGEDVDGACAFVNAAQAIVGEWLATR